MSDPSRQDEVVDGWPRSRRESLARGVRPLIAFSHKAVVPIGLIALVIAIYVARDEISNILR